MLNLNSLKELDDFQIYKQFIKNFIVLDETLYRLIYFNVKNPLDEVLYPFPQKSDKIFTTEKESEDDNHGVVLFKQKNSEILNYGTTIVLVDFETTRRGTSEFFDNLYIIFRVIGKSDDIQELEDEEENTINRLTTIIELIDNNFNLANVNNIGIVKRQSLNPLSINDENFGYTVIYKVAESFAHLSNNKNYQIKKYGRVL